MGLRGILAELRHRGVLKVATAYLAGGLVVLEAGTHLLHNFEAPHWVLKVFTSLLIFGFPIACLMAWGFEFGPTGVHPAPPMSTEAAPKSRRTDALFAAILAAIFVLMLVLVAAQWREPVATAQPTEATHKAAAPAPTLPEPAKAAVEAVGPAHAVPIVVIMDTYAPRGVYEAETREKGGTNADDLNELLRDLPINIVKETIGATWEREDQVLAQRPELILVHRSGFFHAMAQEFAFAYPDDTKHFDEKTFRRLYEVAENKLVATLGYIGRSSPDTKFVVYSRGTGGGWTDEAYRVAWVKAVEGRFPFLKGRVSTIDVPGGTSGGSFDEAETAKLFRGRVEGLLALPGGPVAAGSGQDRE